MRFFACFFPTFFSLIFSPIKKVACLTLYLWNNRTLGCLPNENAITAQKRMVYVIPCTFSKSYYELILIDNFEQKYYMTCSVGDKFFVYSVYAISLFYTFCIYLLYYWCVSEVKIVYDWDSAYAVDFMIRINQKFWQFLSFSREFEICGTLQGKQKLNYSTPTLKNVFFIVQRHRDHMSITTSE